MQRTCIITVASASLLIAATFAASNQRAASERPRESGTARASSDNTMPSASRYPTPTPQDPSSPQDTDSTVAIGPIDHFVIAGGGGTSAGGNIRIDGTAAEVSASNAQTGGQFSLSGGFWNTLGTTALITPTPSASPTASPTPSPGTCTFINGDFETNSLAGWTKVTQPGTSGDWFVYSGTNTPFSSFNDLSVPPQGTYAAVSDQELPGTRVLYQDVTVPAGSSHLTLYLYYKNRAATFATPATLDYTVAPNQQFRVDLMKTTAPIMSVAAGDVLALLFRTNPGDPLTMTPTFKSFDMSAFAGQTVRLRFAQVDSETYFEASADAVCLSVDQAPTPTPTPVITPTPTPTPTPSPTATPTPTPTRTPTPTPTVTPTPVPTVTPAAGFDGDINRLVADVPGNGDGNVDQQDLFWYDQFSRGLHCPSDSPFNEFQRLDGNDNGSIDGGDYTYITNVFLGISPKIAAKGTATKPANLCFGVPSEPPLTDTQLRAELDEINDAPREMRLTNEIGQPGRDVYVYLEMSAQGDERSTSTSIRWDPAFMTISGESGIGNNPDIESGSGAVRGQLIGVNATGVENGELGLLVDFSGGSGDSSVQAGTRRIIRMRFHVRQDAPVGTETPIELGDSVLPQQTVDTSGHIATVRRYVGGGVTIAASPRPLIRWGGVMAPVDQARWPMLLQPLFRR